MQSNSVVRLIFELLGGDIQFGDDFVDDRTGSTRALIVHRRNFLLGAPARVLLENDDLGILSTEFDDGIDFRMELLDSESHSINLLHKPRADQVCQGVAAGTGDERAAVIGTNPNFFLHFAQEIEQHFGLTAVMPLVVAPENAVAPGFHHDTLHGRGPDVNPDEKGGVHFCFAACNA